MLTNDALQLDSMATKRKTAKCTDFRAKIPQYPAIIELECAIQPQHVKEFVFVR